MLMRRWLLLICSAAHYSAAAISSSAVVANATVPKTFKALIHFGILSSLGYKV